MQKIEVNTPYKSYPIYTGTEIISDLSKLLADQKMDTRIALITNRKIAALHLRKLSIPRAEIYFIPDGEKYKNIEEAWKIFTWLIEKKFDRETVLIAFGGGVIGDLAGFVASTFLRGIRLIHVPTTLLAQVDSSVGGKTGINHELGKNLVGTFYQPEFVLSDSSLVNTLDEEEYLCGLGEIVKYALIVPGRLKTDLSKHREKIFSRDVDLLSDIIAECVRIKADIVEKDEKESGLRKILNLGHTFGHALENYYGYTKIKHGQAVLEGILASIRFSLLENIINADKAEELTEFVKLYLPAETEKSDSEIDQLTEIMHRDKKVSGGKINLILLKDFGKPLLYPVKNPENIKKAFRN